MVGGLRLATASVRPGKTWYPLYRRVGGAPGTVWTAGENVTLTGFRSPERKVRRVSLYRLIYRDLHTLFHSKEN